MGVLIPGNDMTAVRRTAAFFLQNLQERLDSQRAEAAANAEYSKTFKGQASKEEKTAKRKQILSNIGEDLLLASADKVRADDNTLQNTLLPTFDDPTPDNLNAPRYWLAKAKLVGMGHIDNGPLPL